jgi:hypothetical protein
MLVIDKGYSKISAKFEKDSYNVGEIAKVECFVDNTNCSKSIDYLKIKFKRLLRGTGDSRNVNSCEEIINEKVFQGMPKGKSGVIHLDCSIQLTKDTERFIEHVPHPYPIQVFDALKALPVPTVQSTLIECFYFIEVHPYFEGALTADNLKTLRLPILVCRPIIINPISSSILPQEK